MKSFHPGGVSRRCLTRNGEVSQKPLEAEQPRRNPLHHAATIA